MNTLALSVLTALLLIFATSSCITDTTLDEDPQRDLESLTEDRAEDTFITEPVQRSVPVDETPGTFVAPEDRPQRCSLEAEGDSSELILRLENDTTRYARVIVYIHVYFPDGIRLVGPLHFEVPQNGQKTAELDSVTTVISKVRSASGYLEMGCQFVFDEKENNSEPPHEFVESRGASNAYFYEARTGCEGSNCIQVRSTRK